MYIHKFTRRLSKPQLYRPLNFLIIPETIYCPLTISSLLKAVQYFKSNQ